MAPTNLEYWMDMSLNENLAPEKIVNLNDWKGKKSQDNSLKNYYSALSFNQLISEATEALNKIKNSDELDRELLLKSKLLLQEFNLRIESLSNGYTTSLKGIRFKVEKKLIELNNRLQK